MTSQIVEATAETVGKDEFDRAKVFEFDGGFGERLTVRVLDGNEMSFVQIFDPDRDAIISIDVDLWVRIAKKVADRLDDK